MEKNKYLLDLTPLVEVVEKLRDKETGCPWDSVQTHASLRRYFVEEVYEVLDAIDQKDAAGLKEELGDVLYQVVLHAIIASEEGLFDVQDVVEAVKNKMIRRHPAIFSEKGLENKVAGMVNWDRLKQSEQRQQHEHLLDGVAGGLPSLLEAMKLQEKASQKSFDWADVRGVWEKFAEERQEFKEALKEKDPDHAEEEAGDVLFVFANLCRHYQIEPETALHRANAKFRRRFSHVEQRVKESGRSWQEFAPEELDAFWREAKAQERNKGQSAQETSV